MCGGSQPQAAAPPPPPAPAPAPPKPPPPQVAGPMIATIPAEEKAQKKVKTASQRRRSAAGGVTGKKRFTIPLNRSGNSGVNV